MTIAIYKKNEQLLKTTNLEKKEKKLGKLDVIWKEEFNGTMTEGEAILDKKLKELKEESQDDFQETKLYYWTNPETGEWLISIYDRLSDRFKGWISKTKKEYDKWNTL